MKETLVLIVQSQGPEWRVGARPASDFRDPYVYLEDTSNPSEIGVHWVPVAKIMADWEILSGFRALPS